MTAASALSTLDATIARLNAHIAEYNRVLTEIEPVKHLFHIPRDAAAWPHLSGRTFTATLIREDIAFCEKRLHSEKRARLHLVSVQESAA